MHAFFGDLLSVCYRSKVRLTCGFNNKMKFRIILI